MRFFKGKLKPAPEPEKKPEEKIPNMPELTPGMKVEVLTTENDLLFVGRLTLPETGGALELGRESGDPLPQALYNSKVKLRGFQKDSTAFAISGVVTKSSPDFWRVEELAVLQIQDSRTFFRQRTNIDGLTAPSGRPPAKDDRVSCKILDISAGGARFISTASYSLGDRLVLETAPIDWEDPFSIICEIRRVTEIEGEKFEYGCQFINLEGREQERLLRSIFVLQRRMLQSRRG